MTFDEAKRFCKEHNDYKVFDIKKINDAKTCLQEDMLSFKCSPNIDKYMPAPARKWNYDRLELEDAERWEPRIPKAVFNELEDSIENIAPVKRYTIINDILFTKEQIFEIANILTRINFESSLFVLAIYGYAIGWFPFFDFIILAFCLNLFIFVSAIKILTALKTNLAVAFFLALLSMIPFASLVAVLLINIEARRFLKAAGLEFGFFRFLWSAIQRFKKK